MEFIEQIHAICLEIDDSPLPYPLLFIGYLCTYLEYSPCKRKIHDFIDKYLNKYFLSHYKPEQLPKVYAIVVTRYKFIDDGDESRLLALKYLSTTDETK